MLKLIVLISAFISLGGLVFSPQVPSQAIQQLSFVSDIPCPEGFKRIPLGKNDFGYYLRNLPLKTEDNIVKLYNGMAKYNQSAHYRIIKMDVGEQDLQQCADAVMRLRAEYLYGLKKYESIGFSFLSDGKTRYYSDYAAGDYSYKKFRKYMNYVFSYANTSSLKRDLKKVENPSGDIFPGDVFIQSGTPYGHAVIVIDVAVNPDGKKAFMLAQSFMPAQEIHILKNINDTGISPWYFFPDDGELKTPEWYFNTGDLRRFNN